jgi:hypothetical protein
MSSSAVTKFSAHRIEAVCYVTTDLGPAGVLVLVSPSMTYIEDSFSLYYGI